MFLEIQLPALLLAIITATAGIPEGVAGETTEKVVGVHDGDPLTLLAENESRSLV